MDNTSKLPPDTIVENATKYKDGHKVDNNQEKVPLKDHHDLFAWIGGVIFILGFCGAMFGIGFSKNYDPRSGYHCNSTDVCDTRFLSEPIVEEPGVHGRYGSTAPGRWYFWKLRPDLTRWYTKIFPWMCYLAHQLFVWIITYVLHSQKRELEKSERYSTKPTKWNWILFGGNMGFHLLHLLQTNITYDGTAANVSVGSSTAAMIMLLIFVMTIEYRDRGLLFGWPSSFSTRPCSMRARLPLSPIYLIRRYHGYAFSWACVYTLWYHPLEGTWGHITGAFHIYMLLMQGSLAFTRMHLNKYWRLFLEVWVTIHGGVVAAQTGGPDLMGTRLWPMFVFGFGFVFFVTQLYGLPFWQKIPAWVRVFPILVIYVPSVLYVYSWAPDDKGKTWVRLAEIIRIPAIYYLFFVVIWAWAFLLITIQDKCMPVKEKVFPWQRGLALVGIALIYALFVGISVLVEAVDWTADVILIMCVLVGLFMMGITVANILFNLVFQEPSNSNNQTAQNVVEPADIEKTKI